MCIIRSPQMRKTKEKGTKSIEMQLQVAIGMNKMIKTGFTTASHRLCLEKSTNQFKRNQIKRQDQKNMCTRNRKNNKKKPKNLAEKKR